MRFNPFSQHSILGLDIQADGIRLVKLNKKRQIERMLTKPVPDQVFWEGKLTNWEKLHVCLSELVIEERLNGMAAAICLPHDQVKMQRIQLPVSLSDADIEAEIFLHLQKDLFPARDTVRIDYSILAQQENAMEIFFVAASDNYLSQYVACVNASGLKVKIIEVDVFAAKRAVKILLQSTETRHPRESGDLLTQTRHPRESGDLSKVEMMLQKLNKADYLIAYGLAMRAIPAW